MQKRIRDLDVACRRPQCPNRAGFLVKFRDRPALVWFTELVCLMHAGKIMSEYGQTECFLRIPQGVYDGETIGL